MKKIFKISSLIFPILILGLLVVNCGSSMPDVDENSTANTSGETQNTAANNASGQSSTVTAVEFDPVELGDDGVLIPRAPSISNKINDTTSNIPIEEKYEEQERQGFRIQIFSSSTNLRAREIEKKASGQFSEGVYLIYDPPTYKVRVGNCLTKEEADIIRQKAVSLGYRDAWVVRDKIIVKVKVE